MNDLNNFTLSKDTKKEIKFSFLRTAQKPDITEASASDSNKRSKSVVDETKKYANKLINKSKDYDHGKNLLDNSDISFFNNKETKETKEDYLHSKQNYSIINHSSENQAQTSHNCDSKYSKNNSQFQSQTNDYETLNKRYENVVLEAEHWRKCYFNLLKESINFDDTIRSLLEENRIHSEYIISLEKKSNKLLTSCTNMANNFHSSFSKMHNLEGSNSSVDISNTNNTNENKGIRNIDNHLVKNFNEILNDYKKQLEILADEKDNNNTNLAVSRHQNLQLTMQLEQLQTRVVNYEKLKIEELKFIEK